MSTPLFPRRVGRRTMLKQGAGLLAAPLFMPLQVPGAPGPGRQLPPSDRITIGVIGLGVMGGGHFRRLLRNPQVQVLAASDVDQWRLNDAKTRAEAAYGDAQKSGQYRGFAAYPDFRDLLARPDIDAVYLATGERWHTVMSIMAAKAGKDIYCEKPVSLSIRESRALINAVNRYGRIFQAGLQQRSTREFRSAVELVRNGAIGRVKFVYMNWVTPSREMHLPAQPVPDTLDWEMWIGPSVWHPFNHEYHQLGQPKSVVPWLNNRDFSGGAVLANGVHPLDIMQWSLGMDESGPVEVIPPSKGTTRDVVTFKYSNGVVAQMVPGVLDPATQHVPEGFDPTTKFSWEVLWVGDDGWIVAGREGLFDTHPKSLLDQANYGTPTGPAGATVIERLIRDASVTLHHYNFLHGVRMRQQPNSHVGAAAHSTNLGHLANIAYRTDRVLTWDAHNERFVNDEEANALREREIRAPWSLV
jgi:predicted dehydrogenase